MIAKLLNRRGRWTRLVLCALLLQTGGCMFDSDLFFSTAITEISGNTSLLFFSTIFSELLKVSPF